MDSVRAGLFRAAYLLYTNTSLGYYYHAHNLSSAQKKFTASAHRSHSKQKTVTFGCPSYLELHVIPFCLDNYAYIVVDTKYKTALIIDPGDAEPILAFFRQNLVIKPIAVLCTHKHWDHCAGNGLLLERYPYLQVFASEDDGAYLSNSTFRDAHRIQFETGPFGAKVVAYEMPGHTVGHALYCITPLQPIDSESERLNEEELSGPIILKNDIVGARDDKQTEQNGCLLEQEDQCAVTMTSAVPLLFTGDCLFVNGIGQMFECPSVVMAATLQRISHSFPDHTLVFPGHEYTLTFIKFALSDVDPDNPALKKRSDRVLSQLSKREPTVPVELGEEKQCNPFLRAHQLSSEKPEFLKKSPSDVLQLLAEKKAKFSKAMKSSNSSESNPLNQT